MVETRLPSAFAELEGFAQTWCLPTEAERWDRRMASSMIEMRQFYDAFFPRVEEAIEWAKRCPGSDNEVIEIRQVQEMSDFPPDVQKAAEGFDAMQRKASRS